MSIPLAQRANAPEFVPFPGEHHGIEWEQLTADHHVGLAALFARMEARDNPPYRTSPDEVEEMLSGASQWRGLVGIARRGIATGGPSLPRARGVRVRWGSGSRFPPDRPR